MGEPSAMLALVASPIKRINQTSRKLFKNKTKNVIFCCGWLGARNGLFVFNFDKLNPFQKLGMKNAINTCKVS
jgi:hypothetical protein